MNRPPQTRNDKPSRVEKSGGKRNRLTVGRPAPEFRRAVVILGMHRSGTSAFGGSMARLGVDFGERLAPPAPDNEKGFWEHQEVVALHDKLLQELGSKWDDAAALPQRWLRRKETRIIQASLAAVVARDFSDKSVFGLKDPRLSRLVPLWLPIFSQLAIKPYFVLMVRHPWEIAQSLGKRNGIPPAKSALLWLRYMLEAEKSTRGELRSFVGYNQLLDSAGSVLANVLENLNLPTPSPRTIERKLGGFLEQSLRHHRAREATNKRAARTPSIALEIYNTLCEAATSRGIPAKMFTLATQFERFSAVFQPPLERVVTAAGLQERLNPACPSCSDRHQENEEQSRRILDLQATAEERARHIAALQEENKEKTEQAAHFQREADEKTKHVALLQRENEEKTGQMLHFRNDAEERANHIRLLQAENEEKAKLLTHFKGDAEERSRHIAVLQADCELKTQQVFHFKNDAEERARHIQLLQAENEEKTQLVVRFQNDAEERARHIAVLQADCDVKTKQVFHFKSDAEERARHIQLLQAENEEKTQLLVRFKGDAEEKARHVAVLQRENQQKTEQVFHFKKDAEERARHIALLTAENEEKTTQVTHFKNESENAARFLAQLQGELEEQLRQVAFFKADAEEKAKQILQLQDHLQTNGDRIAGLQGETDEQREVIEQLTLQLTGAEKRLKRIKSQLADAHWAVFTARKQLVKQIASTKAPSARFLEIENRAATAETQRDQLRTMIQALQDDINLERLRVQGAEAARGTTMESLEQTTKELRSQQKQMDRLRNRLTGKLILPFGKTQRKLQELAAQRGDDV